MSYIGKIGDLRAIAAPRGRSEPVICLGCANQIPENKAHNEISAGTLCENCYQMAGEDEWEEDAEFEPLGLDEFWKREDF